MSNIQRNASILTVATVALGRAPPVRRGPCIHRLKKKTRAPLRIGGRSGAPSPRLRRPLLLGALLFQDLLCRRARRPFPCAWSAPRLLLIGLAA